MTKTKEELKSIEEEARKLNQKLKELSEEELAEISGGDFLDILKKIGKGINSVTKPVVKTDIPTIPSDKINPNK